MNAVIKLSSPVTHEFWEIPVLFEDEHLLALDKPAGLSASPDHDPARPDLMKLLHAGIAAGKPWAREHNLTYLNNVHRLDIETSGVFLLAKSKPVFVALADLFGSEQPERKYVALVQGTPNEDRFAIEAKLAPHPVNLGLMRVDPTSGKKSQTRFEVLEKFPRYTLLKCEPLDRKSVV